MEYNIYVYRHNLGVHKSSHPVSVGNVTLNLFVFKAGLAYSIKWFLSDCDKVTMYKMFDRILNSFKCYSTENWGRSYWIRSYLLIMIWCCSSSDILVVI